MLVGAVLGTQIAVIPASGEQGPSGTQEIGEEKEVTFRTTPGTQAIGEEN